MSTLTATYQLPYPAQSAPGATLPATLAKARWSLAFVGILGYLLVEYTRLAAMYPILQFFHLGKVTVAIALAGLMLSPVRLGPRAGESRLLDRAVWFFAVAALVSAVFAQSQELAWEYMGYLGRWAVIFVLISRVVSNTWRLRVLLFLLLLLNLKLAQFVIRSYFFEVSLGRDEMNLVVHGVGAGSTGFFSNSADFGVAMCVIWPIAVSLLFARPKGWWKLLLLAGAVLFPLAALLCGSRGAVIGAAAVALAAWIRSSRKLVAACLAVLLVIGFFMIYPESSKERMQSAWNWEKDKTARNRIHLWKYGLRLFAEHPILGVGPGNFPVTRGAQNLSETVAHSTYIETLSEYGLAGLLAVAMAVFAFFLLNARTRRQIMAREKEVIHNFQYCLSFGFDLAMIGYLVSGAFVSVLTYPHLWLLMALSVGLNAASRPVAAPTHAPQSPLVKREVAALSWS
ncbi:MAG: O-antigen ligase family protein [Acidobacteria bacterium]|nr:O-antigen ligase family protein [Acidobacteriota bacterium]